MRKDAYDILNVERVTIAMFFLFIAFIVAFTIPKLYEEKQVR